MIIRTSQGGYRLVRRSASRVFKPLGFTRRRWLAAAWRPPWRGVAVGRRFGPFAVLAARASVAT
jgi:hypothetical protein